MAKILVTGANGFVGRKLCSVLQMRGCDVRAAIRCHAERNEAAVAHHDRLSVSDVVAVGDIGSDTVWSDALKNVEVVVHLAARVHIMQEMSKNPLESFRSVNVLGSKKLAEEAARRGIRRFVYISSISIHGNSTGERAYVEGDEAQPHSPYAVSKWEGELALRNVAEKTGFELVIVRPPLVYGPGVGGNFLRLMKWADKGFPLPLGRVHNLRSFIGIENLVELLVRCVEHPRAAGETFLVADGGDLSTPDLMRRVAKLLGRPARIVPFPVSFLRWGAKVFGQEDVLDRLCNCLQVDAGKAIRLLGWKPLMSLDEGLERTTGWYVEEYRRKKHR
ncbi:MAG: NAD-dependent epimerase/dehydratase family protein [Pseudomonadota bacterium]